MNLDWATKRKLQYFALIVIAIMFVFVIPFYIFIYKTPTCFDGIRNGNETGVDCGGSCRLICSVQIDEPISRWDPRVFRVSDGVYSAIAYLENPNIAGEVINAPYTFTLYDRAGAIITERSGVTFIPRGSAFAVFEGRIETGERIPVRAAFRFNDNLSWTRNTAPMPDITVLNKALVRPDSSPRVDASVSNNGFDRLRNIEFVAIISDGAGNAIGASRTFVEYLERGETIPLVFTWPEPFETRADICESPVDVALVIDRSGSMEFLNKTPPQPLTDVKDAAVYFVNQLGKNDQATVVSFGNEASVDSTLTSQKDALIQKVDSISILTDSVQNTNFADGITKAFNELFSERGRNNVGKVIVALTDGVATLPKKTGDETYPETFALEEVAKAKMRGVSLFTIGLGRDLNQDFLRKAASSSAEFFLAPSAKELTTIYNQIATKMCKRIPASIEIIPRVYPEAVTPRL